MDCCLYSRMYWWYHVSSIIAYLWRKTIVIFVKRPEHCWECVVRLRFHPQWTCVILTLCSFDICTVKPFRTSPYVELPKSNSSPFQLFQVWFNFLTPFTWTVLNTFKTIDILNLTKILNFLRRNLYLLDIPIFSSLTAHVLQLI